MFQAKVPLQKLFVLTCMITPKRLSVEFRNALYIEIEMQGTVNGEKEFISLGEKILH